MATLKNYEPLLEENGMVQFTLVIQKATESSCEFEVYEVISWNLDNSPAEVERYLRGHIKWDGCSHLWFGDDAGYIHLCGQTTFISHAKVIAAVWEKVTSKITGFDKDIAQ